MDGITKEMISACWARFMQLPEQERKDILAKMAYDKRVTPEVRKVLDDMRSFATQVQEMMDLQQKYFNGHKHLIDKCKIAENGIRASIKGIMIQTAPSVQINLFD